LWPSPASSKTTLNCNALTLIRLLLLGVGIMAYLRRALRMESSSAVGADLTSLLATVVTISCVKPRAPDDDLAEDIA